MHRLVLAGLLLAAPSLALAAGSHAVHTSAQTARRPSLPWGAPVLLDAPGIGEVSVDEATYSGLYRLLVSDCSAPSQWYNHSALHSAFILLCPRLVGVSRTGLFIVLISNRECQNRRQQDIIQAAKRGWL